MGCYSTANQVVVVNPSPTVNILASKTAVCAGESVILTASGASTYTWTNGPMTAGYTVTPTSSGIYTVIGMQSPNPCPGKKTISITAVNPNVTVSSNTAVCEGGTTTLTAMGASSYTWNGVPMGANGNFPVSPSGTTVYSLVANTQSAGLNCLSTHTIEVSINPNPTITVVATKSLICKGTTNTLTASGAVSYDWGTVGSAPTVTVKPTATTIYSVNGTDANGCVGFAIVQAFVSSCNGINEQTSTAGINLYPNPNKGDFYIAADVELSLKLINALGQEVKTMELNAQNGRKSIVQDLANGIYFVTGEHEGHRINLKVIVSK